MRQAEFQVGKREALLRNPRSHHTARGFVNPHCRKTRRSVWDAALWGMGFYRDPKPIEPVPAGWSYPNPRERVDLSQPTVCWINHTTCLLSIDGVHILTDPIWNNRCSPTSWLGPRRRHAAPIALDQLPKIDYVLLSHDHYDHLDKPTILKLAKLFPNCYFFVPLGVERWFHKHGITNVLELDWWESFSFPSGVRSDGVELEFHAVPAQHFSGRGSVGQNSTLWCGWVVTAERASGEMKRIYFVGDTGYNGYDFLSIGETFGPFDLSLIPIGAYSPRSFMGPVHVHPEESVAIHLDANSRLSLGVHWKTFRLSEEGQNQPPYDLYRALLEVELSPEEFRVTDPGQWINW